MVLIIKKQADIASRHSIRKVRHLSYKLNSPPDVVSLSTSGLHNLNLKIAAQSYAAKI